MSAEARQDTFAEYRAAEGENASGLKPMSKSPLQYKHEKVHGSSDSDPKRFGRHIHTGVLEPHLFDSSFVEWTGGLTQKGTHSMRKGTKAWDAFEADVKLRGLDILTTKQVAEIGDISRAVLANREAHRLLNTSEHEVSVYWEHPRFTWPMKMRADMLKRDEFIADLKSTTDVRTDKLEKDVFEYGYHESLALYQDGIEVLTGRKLPVFIVVVESAAPHDCVVYRVQEYALQLGRQVYERNLARVIECTATGIWPGYSDEVLQLGLPPWAQDEQDLDWEGIEVKTA